jgi:hypothetical protein
MQAARERRERRARIPGSSSRLPGPLCNPGREVGGVKERQERPLLG